MPNAGVGFWFSLQPPRNKHGTVNPLLSRLVHPRSRLSDFLQQKRLPSLEAPSTVERSSSEGLNTEARAADGSTALHLAARQVR